MTQAPYFWLRKLESQLKSYDAIPLFGSTVPFDWAHLSSTLTARLGVQEFTVSKGSQQWRTSEDLMSGLGKNPITYPLKMGPLSGSAFWIMPKESITKLSMWMMNGQSKGRPQASDVVLEGFYRYLMLQALDCASAVEPLRKLSMILSDQSPAPETDAFCIDIEIAFGGQTCWGRLAIDPLLQKSWQEYFSSAQEDYIPTKIAQITELTAAVRVGAVHLQSEELKKLKPGDFISLDRGDYEPHKEAGAAYLTVGEVLLFQVKNKAQ